MKLNAKRFNFLIIYLLIITYFYYLFLAKWAEKLDGQFGFGKRLRAFSDFVRAVRYADSG